MPPAVRRGRRRRIPLDDGPTTKETGPQRREPRQETGLSKHTRERAGGLVRDVVVGRGRGGRGAVGDAGGRGRGEVVRVDGDVGAGGEAASAAAAFLATAEELDVVGDDLDRLAVVALLVLPLAPLESAVD